MLNNDQELREDVQFSAEEHDEEGPSTPRSVATPIGIVSSGFYIVAPRRRHCPPWSIVLVFTVSTPKQPVHTTQQLYDWFALIDRSVAHSQEAHFRAHIATVSQHLDTCDFLLSKVDEIEQDVDVMLENWRSVEDGGKSLKDACERLLEEKHKLVELTDDIGSYLEYFQQLDMATEDKVDICIEFLRSRRHFKEAEVYLLRFQQCMTRAMTLIKMNFVGSLRALSSDISKRLFDKDVSQTAQGHLLYNALPLQSYPDELSSLLSECHSAYFSTRKALLVPRIMEEIRGLDPTRSELVELTRTGCSYLKQLCTDEFNLYREFFSITAEDQLYQYLETCVTCFCTVLQALMATGSDTGTDATSDSDDSDDDESDGSDSELTVDLDTASLSSKRKAKGKLGQVGKRLHIRHLLQMVLQDAQTRLFFKAQSLLHSDIKYYAPRKEDLAWPDVIVSANQPKTGMEIREKETASRLFKTSLTQQETWYPTVRKMVWILSQLHDFVKPAIFEDIAQEAALLTRLSLLAARDLIKVRPPPSTPLDAHLFLVRHLLILKEVAKTLEGESGAPHQQQQMFGQKGTLGFPGTPATGNLEDGERDFWLRDTCGIKWRCHRYGFHLDLKESEGLLLLSVLRGDESIQTAKHGIDFELRRACEDVINLCRASLRSYGRLGKPNPDGKHIHKPDSGSQIMVLNAQFRAGVERDLRLNVGRIRLYLGDADPGGNADAASSTASAGSFGAVHHGRTARILINHIRDRMLETYEGFVDQLKEIVAVTGANSEEVKRALREIEGSVGEVKDAVRAICLGDLGEGGSEAGPSGNSGGSAGASASGS
ncbi:COG3 protein [Coprinopsis sp. MPI-PUGE-AT-0042]|nr:COG3 protein [Coprinopsis sp. MPI-PUGE-AT-0042]